MLECAGPSGELRVGYQVAARLAAWNWYPRGQVGQPWLGGAWGVTALTTERNAYWLAHTGLFTLSLLLPTGQRWRWRNARLVGVEEKLAIHGEGEPEVI